MSHYRIETPFASASSTLDSVQQEVPKAPIITIDEASPSVEAIGVSKRCGAVQWVSSGWVRMTMNCLVHIIPDA